ncbi:hypothetical protein B4110_3696 [Parageobacillus toebii]|uniref:Uncharacterized protein n=1 Tax=Parageobacillus toebii TaxID=153151 RepID=A0A150N1D9_9BACL|nr:hypothetical protein B4110_3696 [Parageobacillus toebii]
MIVVISHIRCFHLFDLEEIFDFFILKWKQIFFEEMKREE